MEVKRKRPSSHSGVGVVFQLPEFTTSNDTGNINTPEYLVRSVIEHTKRGLSSGSNFEILKANMSPWQDHSRSQSSNTGLIIHDDLSTFQLVVSASQLSNYFTINLSNDERNACLGAGLKVEGRIGALLIDGSAEFRENYLLLFTDSSLVAIEVLKQQLVRCLLPTINSKSFYGQSQSYQPKAPSLSIYRSFGKQADAFSYFDSLLPDHKRMCKIFSFEDKYSSVRKFLVVDFDSFISNYLGNNSAGAAGDAQTQAQTKNHVYEIIREGYPCRVYFDVEFYYAHNPHVDGDVALYLWIQLVAWKIYSLWHIFVNEDNVVVLDSSTTEKYSKHIVFVLYVDNAKQDGCEYEPLVVSTSTDESTFSGAGLTSGLDVMSDGISGLKRVRDRDHNHKVGDKSEKQTNAQRSNTEADPHRQWEEEGEREYLFKNNAVVGQLVDAIMEDITYEITAPMHASYTSSSSATLGSEDHQQTVTIGVAPRPRFECLFVWNQDGNKKTCMVDLGVYTRNRAFRLMYSSKFGKSQILFQKQEDKQRYKGLHASRSTQTALLMPDSNMLRKLKIRALLRSFVVPLGTVGGEESLMRSNEGNEGKEKERKGGESSIHFATTNKNVLLSFPNDDGDDKKSRRHAVRFTRMFPMNSTSNTCNDIASTSTENPNNLLPSSSFLPLSSLYTAGGLARKSTGTSLSSRSLPSPFQSLDTFVRVQVCGPLCGNLRKGNITSWSLYPTSSTSDHYKMRYTVTGNRYCNHIKREHRSNGVYIEVDLQWSLMVQKCFDAECRGFVSDAVEIPSTLIPPLDQIKQEYEKLSVAAVASLPNNASSTTVPNAYST